MGFNTAFKGLTDGIHPMSLITISQSNNKSSAKYELKKWKLKDRSQNTSQILVHKWKI
jgi:hypothetical protein